MPWRRGPWPRVEDLGALEYLSPLMRSGEPVVTDGNHPLFHHLASVIRSRDPVGIPVPYIIPGFTDAKAFTRLGAQYFGFTPVRFDAAHGISFGQLYHGNDERIPVDGLAWGTETLYDAVRGWCAA